jgi:hypothetical protein
MKAVPAIDTASPSVRPNRRLSIKHWLNIYMADIYGIFYCFFAGPPRGIQRTIRFDAPISLVSDCGAG